MRVLITGVTGFVGRHLARCLAARGWEVHGTSRGSADLESVRVHALEVTDPSACEALLAELEPRACFHLAGEARPGAVREDPGAGWAVNAGGSWNVARAFGRAGGEVLVLASTGHVYGRPRGEVLGDDHPLDPATPYGACKLAAEAMVEAAARAHGFREVRLRLLNHIGPGQAPGFVVPDLARRLATSAGPIAVGNLEVARDFTDVRDVAEAYARAAETAEVRGAYTVGRGEATPLGWVLERLAAGLGRPAESRVDPALLRAEDPPVIRAAPARFCQATGWSPAIPLEQTLADVAAEVRGERDEGGSS